MRIGIVILQTAVLLLGAASVAADTEVAAEAQAFDRTPVDCIVVSRIRRTEATDDQTILFFMRGGQIYRNYLPRECPGLAREDRFMYQVTGGRLCRSDSITVLEIHRFGLPGMRCPLGLFHPISPDEVEELRLGPAQQIEIDPVERQGEESR